MKIGQLSIPERIAISNQLIESLSPEKLQKIFEEMKKTITPIKVYPPLDFIFGKICGHFSINEEACKSNSRKKEIVYARMIYAKIVANMYIDPGKCYKRHLTKKIAIQLNTKRQNINNYIRKANNFLAIYDTVRTEITYLSMVILMEYSKDNE